jgi:hypothetical protein
MGVLHLAVSFAKPHAISHDAVKQKDARDLTVNGGFFFSRDGLPIPKSRIQEWRRNS